MALGRKQAREQLALGRDPHPRTGMTERPGDTGDHPDLAATITVTPPRTRLATVVRCDLLQRQLRIDTGDDLSRGHHLFHLPAVGAADIHELDETHDVRRTLEVARHRHDVLVIERARLTTMLTLIGPRPTS